MKVKDIIRRIPVVGPLAVWIWTLAKMPLRVPYIQGDIEQLKKKIDEFENIKKEISCQMADLQYLARLTSKSARTPNNDDKALPPIFIHSLWRTGSTYVWSKFRKNPDYHCYYEPLHECLLNCTRSDLENLYKDASDKGLVHPSLSKGYFHEFPLKIDRGVPFFCKSFPYNDYCIEEDQKYPELKKYIHNLILHADDKRPLFQFCRSPLRTRWLKKNFSSVNLYILRAPRDQWESYLATVPEDNYFLAATFMIIGKNPDAWIFAPLHKTLTIPYFESENIIEEFNYYRNVVAEHSLEQRYLVFYYLWLVSLLDSIPACDNIIDIDLLSLSQSARKGLAAALMEKHSINVDFDDCRCPKYDRFSLDLSSMESVEAKAHELVRQLELDPVDFSRFSPFISPTYEKLPKCIFNK